MIWLILAIFVILGLNVAVLVLIVRNMPKRVGTIMVMYGEDEKLIYSLDLSVDPIILKDMREVAFVIDSHI